MAGRTDNRNYKFEETDQYSSVDTFELLRYGVETCNIPMIDMKLRIGIWNIYFKLLFVWDLNLFEKRFGAFMKYFLEGIA